MDFASDSNTEQLINTILKILLKQGFMSQRWYEEEMAGAAAKLERLESMIHYFRNYKEYYKAKP